MFEQYWLELFVIGGLIIASLAFYAGMLLKQVHQQKKAQLSAQKLQQEKLREHDKKILDSVVIIVRAMKEEQCELSEGCWRLSVLLDSLKTSSELASEFPSIFELYNAIKHMPILEERKKLEKRERMKLDLVRMKAESRLQPNIHQDIKRLHQYANERISTLNEHISTAA
ncbi:DUF2489 domain-containing protein [Thalassotalea sp. 1_MG-2023]|uniref:DUF2489 domain-containing protein n=1 Tax=Thalassotalea sp. 1_MG-2023 TaxID=3062680 RepID=UPI0026E440F4|nr:DUF2489 domain-containing protein [Thalassotalea sp. 1_MG-2023]MDO6426082.1 DUF2489 domain-containing protein [Thalassotalea sp. 1_MG-2023]